MNDHQIVDRVLDEVTAAAYVAAIRTLPCVHRCFSRTTANTHESLVRVVLQGGSSVVLYTTLDCVVFIDEATHP